MNKTFTLALRFLVITSALSSSVEASVIFYNDKVSWDSQLASQTITNFNGNTWSPTGTYLATSYTSVQHFQIPVDRGPYGNANASSLFGWTNQPNDLGGVPIVKYTSGGFLEWQDYYGEIIPLTITLPTPTKAIALNLGELYSRSATFVVIIDDSTPSSCTPLFSKTVCGDRTIVTGVANGYKFVGAFSDTPFSTLTIAASWTDAAFNPSGSNHYLAPDIFPIIDNVSIGTPPQPTPSPSNVPEPGAISLFGAGLLALNALRRKRHD